MKVNIKDIDSLLKKRMMGTELEHEEVSEEYLEKTFFNGFNEYSGLFVFLRKKEYSILNDIQWETSEKNKKEVIHGIKKLPKELFLPVDEMIIADDYDFHLNFDNYPVDFDEYLGVAQKEINRIVLNLNNIKSLADNSLVFYENIIITILHEIGHLIISNPFLKLSDFVDYDIEKYKLLNLFYDDIEEELVEDFAIVMYDEFA